MKRLLCITVCVIIFLSLPFCASAYSAASMTVIESTTGISLVDVDSNTRRPMASTTKIMTALIALETLDLNARVTVPAAAVGIEGSSMYLKSGQSLTVSDLLYGLLLRSGNDAAVALAILSGGSLDGFVSLMNERALSLGLTDTHFTNPSGLPDDDHYTTSAELAKIAAAAMQNPDFRSIVSQKSARLSDGTYLQNHNKLLSMYEGCIGIKTGFTKKAGRCLVSAAERNGVTLICVTLNAPDDWNDHMSAYDYAFSRVSYDVVTPAGQLSVPLSTPDGKTVYATNKDDIFSLSFADCALTQKIFADTFVYAPKAKGQTVASVRYCVNGITVAKADLSLTAPLDIKIEKQTLLNKFLNYIKGLFK